jgi:dUTP pyrophosphatase
MSSNETGAAAAELRVKKLSEHATVPARASAHAAGYDLASAEDVVIPQRGKGLAKTDLAIAVPDGTYGRVAPRSGLALKRGIDVGAGVIDADYRGNVGVVLFNHGDEPFEIKRGDRIAQLILERIVTPPVALVDDLDATDRGAGGFGSTGAN